MPRQWLVGPLQRSRLIIRFPTMGATRTYPHLSVVRPPAHYPHLRPNGPSRVRAVYLSFPLSFFGLCALRRGRASATAHGPRPRAKPPRPRARAEAGASRESGHESGTRCAHARRLAVACRVSRGLVAVPHGVVAVVPGSRLRLGRSGRRPCADWHCRAVERVTSRGRVSSVAGRPLHSRRTSPEPGVLSRVLRDTL